MPVNFPGNVLTCSGPKGRGFESRHFDRTENPGSVRLPGPFLFPAICGKAGENVQLLGETSGQKSREPLKNNGSRLGEMGENIPCRPGSARKSRGRWDQYIVVYQLMKRRQRTQDMGNGARGGCTISSGGRAGRGGSGHLEEKIASSSAAARAPEAAARRVGAAVQNRPARRADPGGRYDAGR